MLVNIIINCNVGSLWDDVSPCRADQFFTVGGDSSRRLPEDRGKSATGVASYNPILEN